MTAGRRKINIPALESGRASLGIRKMATASIRKQKTTTNKHSISTLPMAILKNWNP